MNASAMLTAKANHDHITIDFFYHGSTVSVRGISDPGVDLVVKITSPEGHQVLKQKGGQLKLAGACDSAQETAVYWDVLTIRTLINGCSQSATRLFCQHGNITRLWGFLCIHIFTERKYRAEKFQETLHAKVVHQMRIAQSPGKSLAFRVSAQIPGPLLS